VQQILVVDLLLRKKAPFPLGLLVKCSKIFLEAARSRVFNCVQLLAIMAEELSAFDIEPDVAGRGQFVSVIERKTRTI
jgi:hypothetical protein